MPFVLAVDYDGTLFEGSWPNLGNPKEDVIDHVKEFKEAGAEIVLWTCREGVSLEEALIRCKEVGLEFDSVNESSPSQKIYIESRLEYGEVFCTRKIFANLYLDDRANNIHYFLTLDSKETCEGFENVPDAVVEKS